jgi:RNA polymerase sigma factor (TIGR02999 family)
MLEVHSDGSDRNPTAALMPLVYDDLRRLASRLLRRERRDHTLQPTALVHEIYVQLAAWKAFRCASRAQFFGVAALMMRRVLAAAGRRHASLKAGGALDRVPLDDAAVLAEPLLEVMTLDLALQRLESFSPQACRVLELRVFGGLTIEEAAEFLGVSPMTVKRSWQAGRAWLYRELGGDT